MGENSIMDSNWKNMERNMQQYGFREGAEEGRKKHFQDGFDVGYQEGFKFGQTLGMNIGVNKFTLQDSTNKYDWNKLVQISCQFCDKDGPISDLEEKSLETVIKDQNKQCNNILEKLDTILPVDQQKL